MPIIEVEDQRFDFPEGTTDEVIGQAVRVFFANLPPTQQEPGIIDQIGEMFTGSRRATPQTEALPEIQELGFENLAGAGNKLAAAALTPAILSTTNTDEIVKIITSNIPDIGVTYNKDAQGNIFIMLKHSGDIYRIEELSTLLASNHYWYLFKDKLYTGSNIYFNVDSFEKDGIISIRMTKGKVLRENSKIAHSYVGVYIVPAQDAGLLC